jgi:glycosyltransferase involved in cell wall biosynthesis
MTSVLLDDIIFQLQRFGGASDFWRHLSRELDHVADLDVRHCAGRKWKRFLPVAATCDVMHSSHFRVPLRRSQPCVTTIHDLTYEFGMISGAGARPNRWQRRIAVKRAQAIVAISESTRRDILEVYGDLISPDVLLLTIPHGRSYTGPTGEALPQRLRSDRPYVLHVGNRSHYKNFEQGVRGFSTSASARDGVQLWCTGPEFTSSERDLIASLGSADHVRHLGLVTSKELGSLYEHAEALLYPSIYEGFGLPPLDAMSLGCPVVAANKSSIPEVVADAGVLVDVSDPDAIAAGIDLAIRSSERSLRVARGLARAALFSWATAGAAYAAVYRQLA